MHLTLDFLICKMSSSGGDGGRCRSSRLEKGKAVVYAMSPDEYESMEGLAERASRQVAKELQHHFDSGGEDMSSAPGITIQELVQPSVVSTAVGSAEVLAEEGSVAPCRVAAPKRRRAS